MTTRQEAIAACLQLPDVYEDYPFDDFNWTAIRHRANQKIFALIFEWENHIWINVKDVDIRRLIEESFALTDPKTRIPRTQKSMHHPPKR